ncbi:MAG: 30S ribosome-binding factor RbfA [Candidatus Pacebacteria bacterium]|nr:30S ribosome-binding factor RbfA [Candidatus Paceibacterota bacterium]MDD4333951.1 30S ribosome-binding factor RbfA [Candidatus Paceibacterota bacterium]
MYKKEKLNNIIQKELAQIFLKELDFSSNVVVTITRVEVSLNGFSAKVFVSVLPEENKDFVFKVLNNNIYSFQQKINKKLKIRPVPRIEYAEEKRTKEAAKIEEILKKIKDLEKK